MGGTDITATCNIRHRPTLLKQVEEYTTAYTGSVGPEVRENGLLCGDSEGQEVLIPGQTIIYAAGSQEKVCPHLLFHT